MTKDKGKTPDELYLVEIPGVPLVPIGEVKPYPNNPRINDESVRFVINSIKAVKFRAPITVDGQGVILTGHTRLKAAKKLGLTKVPVIKWDDITEEQARLYRISDNSAGEKSVWNEVLLNQEWKALPGFNPADFGLDNVQVGVSHPDDVQEAPAPPVPPTTDTPRGIMYRLGEHVLLCGDSTNPQDMARLMGSEVADMVVTDPPYNVDYGAKAASIHNVKRGTSDIQNDEMDDDTFQQFLHKAYTNMANHLKEGGAFYIWYAMVNTPPFFDALKNTGLEVHQCLVWVKNTIVLTRSDYQWQHEPCIYGWKEGASHYFIDDRSQRTVTEYPTEEELKGKTPTELRQIITDMLRSISTDIIREDKPAASDLHPTMKPVRLFARQIANNTKAGEIVLDPFGGSGTTLLACEQLGRKARIMEYDPHYIDVIVQRWEEYTGRKAQKVST